MATQIDAKTARLPHLGRAEGEGDEIRGAWEKNEKRFTSKRSSEYHDPCQDFANRSIRCLHRNGGDKDMCQDYFQAYRDCKKEWTTKRRLGITAEVMTKDKGEGAS